MGKHPVLTIKTGSMKRMALHILTVAFILWGLSSCLRMPYKYNQEGMIVNNQRSYYVNEPLWLVLSMPGDFQYQPLDTGDGARVGRGFRGDAAIYRKLGIDPKNAYVLYSATPVKPPAYHLTSLIFKDSTGLTKGFTRKIFHAEPSYYYRTLTIKGKEIYEVLLPYNNTYVAMIYYAPANTSCHYCDIENIASYNYGWVIKNKGAQADTSLRLVTVDIPPDSVLANQMAVLLIHRLDTTGKISYQTFVPMGAGSARVDLNLNRGTYEFKYMDRQQQIRWATQRDVQ